jgi:glutamine synthetase
LQKLLKDILVKHNRIIFNGNNYSDDWVDEAAKRDLPNIKSMVEALPHYISEKSIAVFEKHNVLSKEELHSRYEILLEQYCKVINIEAKTMLDMANRVIFPAVAKYAGDLAGSVATIKSAVSGADTSAQEAVVKEISYVLKSFKEKTTALQNAVEEATGVEGYEAGVYYRDKVFSAMSDLRIYGDKLETLVDADLWPLPTYAEMLFLI